MWYMNFSFIIVKNHLLSKAGGFLVVLEVKKKEAEASFALFNKVIDFFFDIGNLFFRLS